MDREELQRQIGIMTDPALWQNRRVLPLVRKRGGQQTELGFLYLDATRAVRLLPTVYLGSCLKVVERTSDKTIVMELTHDQITKLTAMTYPTMASVAYAGWRVDEY